MPSPAEMQGRTQFENTMGFRDEVAQPENCTFRVFDDRYGFSTTDTMDINLFILRIRLTVTKERN